MKQETFNRLVNAVLAVAVVILVVFAVLRISGASKARGSRQTSDQWAKLMLVLGAVDRDYVDDIDRAAVTEEILPELLSKLDPHSVYLPPVELKKSEEDLQGGFDGIGVQFNVPEDTAIVTNIIAGGPAEKAGLLTGDRLLKVDDRPIAGVKMDQDTMVSLMRGLRGTKVVITVGRERVKNPIPFELVRDKIPVNSVDVSFMLNDTTGYVKLSKFSKTSYQEFLLAVAGLLKQGMKKLVFDLRENNGGYFDQAILLCNEFLEKGSLIVYMEGRNRPREDVFADGRGLCRGLELAVLIDEQSASSSEIFAGAMQDNDRAVIYGLRSFGKGLVQEPVYFSDGSGVRLTVARFYTPSGRCIQKPYRDDYAYDIYERYSTGEMLSADSIRVNDSLRYETVGGRTVYGGGGIIPDVFVPLDTTRVTEYLVQCNRRSLQVKYANKVSDRHRAQLRSLTDLEKVEAFLSTLDLASGFKAFAAGEGVPFSAKDWAVSGDVILTQIKALIARYTPMSDEAFYPIYLRLDNNIEAVLAEKER